jgi:hypothetical protein
MRERYTLLARKTAEGRIVWYVRYYDRSGHRLSEVRQAAAVLRGDPPGTADLHKPV